MKPSFALNLSLGGISLLHRTPGGWHLVGEVDVESADLADTLGFLRQTAAGLDSAGVTTKLILPNTQILYSLIDAPGPSVSDREFQIRAALSGMTPYAVDELVFDWKPAGDKVKVAAVARETLEEAEDFAVQHKFNPLSFVAIPEANDFDGEPFFGETQIASSLLHKGEQLERDAFAVKIVPLPEAAPLTRPEPTEQKVLEELEEVEVTEDVEAIQDVAETNDVEAIEDVEKTDHVEVTEPHITDSAIALDDHIDSELKDELPDLSLEPEDAEAEAEAEAELDPVPAFTSSRQDTDQLGTPESDMSADLPAARLVVLPGDSEGSPPKVAAAAKPMIVTAAVAPDMPPIEKIRHTPAPTITPTETPELVASVIAPKPDHQTENFGLSAPSSAFAPDIPDSEVTVFGARKKYFQGGKPPHLGLVLTAVLIAIMALLAVWSVVFLDDNTSGLNEENPSINETASTAEIPEVSQAQNSEEVLAAIDDAIEGAQDTILAEETELFTEEAEIEIAEVPEPVVPMTMEEAEEAYADSGIWQRAPDAPDFLLPESIDELYIGSIDTPTTTHDAVALPAFDPEPGAGQIKALNNPASSGTVFTLDDRGLVIPSAEGTENADGILIFAGKPPVVTPSRPRSAVLPNSVQIDETVTGQNTALAGFRPAARPADLQQQHERGRFGGLTLSELSAKRPVARPASPQTEPTVDNTPTALAVSRSPAPRNRPGNISELVAAARANTQNAPVAATATAAVPTGRAPTIPTRASVANQATVTNAINLRRISLIGVYGTSSQRRALLRLPSGRYVKVEIGDRVDGGRVAAIGAQELRYVKGGRNITLRMPEI